MKTDSIVVTGVVPATADEVIAAYLDSDAHGAMTGAPAEVDPVVGGAMSAWGGYIEGVFVKLGADAIVQRWRADDFPAGSIDSRLEMRVTQAPKGARVTFAHSELPAGMGEGFARGWELYYLEPMEKFFRDLAETSRAPKPKAKKAVAKKAVAKKAVAKKAVAKKAVAKKAVAKKAVAKKAVAKKAVAKKA
jgi:hypothetical protein